MNPFVTNIYKGPDYFINRTDETKTLIDAINNQRNLTLFSHRRFGKTMLLHHVFKQLAPNTFLPMYLDLYATRSLVHLAQKLSGIMYDNKILPQSRFRKILGSLGASFSFDPITGNPQVSFNVTDRSAVLRSIPELFKLISGIKKKIVIAMDEFQEIARYEEEFAEATIRTLMQEYPEIIFIFSGSKKSLMKEIFTDSSRPFFQSTQMMELHEIEEQAYLDAIYNILKNHQKSFDPVVIRKILEDTYCHTGFTQMVLSRVFSESDHRIDMEVYEQVWGDILENHKSMAREQEFLLPELQWKTLTAIAREGYVKAPQSRAFADKYHLSAPSSMSRAVKALLDKGLIIDTAENGLRVYNVFIEKNLRTFQYD
jgi:hypothetical protein